MQESARPRSGKDHDEREAYAQVILGRRRKLRRLPNESVHNICSARGHALWEFFRKEVVSITQSDIRRDRLRAYSRREVAKARPKVGEMYPHSLEKKGYKCYNPSTRKVRVSLDVVFDESASWYELGTTTISFNLESAEQEIEVEDRLGNMFESLITTRLSRP